MTATGAMTNAPIGPMGELTPADLRRIRRAYVALISAAPNIKSAQEMNAVLTDVFARLVNIPDALPLNAILDAQFNQGNRTPTCPIKYTITASQQQGNSTFSLGNRLMMLTFDIDEIERLLLHIASSYRQMLARSMLLQTTNRLRTSDPALLDEYREIGSVHDERTFALKHPAALITDYQRLCLDFESKYRPVVDNSSSKTPGPKAVSAGTWMGLKIKMPETMAIGLSGQLVSSVIDIEDQYLGKLAPHAVAAWKEARFGALASYQLLDLKIWLQPARAVSWLPGMLPADHMPANDLESALVNLARTGEMV